MMNEQFVAETPMVNYSSAAIQELIYTRKWNTLKQYDRIKSIYNFVQNEIVFGFNRSDTLTAEQILLDGYGQCNTKATLLMALLRGVDIPCRIHGLEVSKHFQRGVTNTLIFVFSPKLIVHTWVEVFYKGEWLALEGVITDKTYFEAVKSMYKHCKKKFHKYAIATDDFENHSIDWQENSTYVQSAAVVTDYGVFESPDVFWKIHSQHWSKIKNFMYIYFGRKMMNRRVSKIRSLKIK